MVSVLAETLVSSSATNSREAAEGARYVGAQSSHPSFFVQFRRFRFKKCFCVEGGAQQVIPADVLISSGALFPPAHCERSAPWMKGFLLITSIPNGFYVPITEVGALMVFVVL